MERKRLEDERRKAEEEQRRKAEEEQRRKAEEEKRRKVEEEQRRKAEEEQSRQMESKSNKASQSDPVYDVPPEASSLKSYLDHVLLFNVKEENIYDCISEVNENVLNNVCFKYYFFSEVIHYRLW